MNINTDNLETIKQEHYKLCLQCDLLVRIPEMGILKNKLAICPRCNFHLENYQNTNAYATIYAICALVLLYLLNFSNIFNFYLLGRSLEISIPSISYMLFDQANIFLIVIFFITVLILPTVFLLCIIIASTKLKIPDYIRVNTLLLIENIKPWCMTDIFFISTLVCFIKLKVYGDIYIENGFYLFVLYIILQTAAYALFNMKLCWQKISDQHYSKKYQIKKLQTGITGLSQRLKTCAYCEMILPINQGICHRCGKKSRARNISAINLVIALLLTSSFLYIPANLFPMMNYTFLGNTYTSNIIDGVISMWQEKDYFVAIIILLASVIIPILKIILMFFLLFFLANKKRATMSNCYNYNRLYNIIKLIGRWSMLDVFVVIIMSTTIDKGFLMDNKPEVGVIFFAIVVIITMIASEKYDPRLIWDKLSNKKESTSS